MSMLGAFSDEHWIDSPHRSVCLKWHGAVVELNTAERYERWAYFLGRYHELPLQLLMRSCLRPGDVFVDVGANIGLVTLLGSWLVGRTGKVIAFEPNPCVGERLQRHVRRNNLTNVEVHNIALGNDSRTLKLKVIGANTGSGTLGTVPDALALDIQAVYEVVQQPGDAVSHTWMGSQSGSATVVKVDAEGAETAIVQGLRRTIDRCHPLIVLEVNPFALRMNNTSPRELRSELEACGYHGWTLDTRRSRLFKHRLALTPLPVLPNDELHDEVWAHPMGVHFNNLRQFLHKA